MYAVLKLVMGILLLGTGGYAYYALFFTYQPKVATCIFGGTTLIVIGIINIINWNKKGVLRELQKTLNSGNKFMHANNQPNDIPRPEMPTPAPPAKNEPSFELTNEEKRRIIKERQQEKGAWEPAPEVEVIPPEKPGAEPYLLRPAVGTVTKPLNAVPVSKIESKEDADNAALSLDQIQDLLKRG